MSSNPVVWFEIYVEDMPRAKAFYEAVLDVRLETLEIPEDMAEADSGGADSGLEMVAFPMQEDGAGAAGALVHAPDVPMKGNGTLVYFGCEDCSVEAGRVASNGGTLEREKFSIGQYGYIALAFDPDGNMFGLHSQQ